MKFSLNKIWIGMVIGILAPLITILIVHKSNYKTLSLMEFIDQLQRMGVYTKMLSICVLPNLLLFFFFIWRNYLASARGMLISTIIYAACVIIYKYAF